MNRTQPDNFQYSQLYHAIQANPTLDTLSFYFLGICTKYIPPAAPLSSIIKQLPLCFSELYEIFMTNKKEIGFLSCNLIRIVYHSFLEQKDLKSLQKSEMELLKIENRVKAYFQDFELVKLLYPQLSKSQWFLLGSLKAIEPSFDIVKVLEEVYIEMLIKGADLDEEGKLRFLFHKLANSNTELKDRSKANINQVSNEKASLRDFAPKDLRMKSRGLNLLNEKTNLIREDKENIDKNLANLNSEILRNKSVPNNLRHFVSKSKTQRELNTRNFKGNLLRSKEIQNLRERLNNYKGSLDFVSKAIHRRSSLREPLVELHADSKTEKNQKEETKELIVSPAYEKKNGISDRTKDLGLLDYNQTLTDPKLMNDCSIKISLSLSNNSTEKIPPEPGCPICYEDFAPDSSIKLKECKHSFHLECVKKHFELKIDSKSFPVSCPMDGCSSSVSESDILGTLDQNYKDKFYSFSLRHFAETHPDQVFFCISPNCEYFAFIEKDTKSFYCITCSKAFCVGCKDDWHDGLTCHENKITKRSDENDQKFDEFVSSNGCRKCPRCLYYVHKVEGCNHITCRCKHEFCYGCGSNMDDCYCEK